MELRGITIDENSAVRYEGGIFKFIIQKEDGIIGMMLVEPNSPEYLDVMKWAISSGKV